MYEKFSDRAKKTMQLANQESHCFNHEYIGTEHILLGLVKEGTGRACDFLSRRVVDLRKIRLEVEKLVQSGPVMVTMGKLPQTPQAKNVIEYSIEEARNLNHNYVGTEHILLGLLREQEGIAAIVLGRAGVIYHDACEFCKEGRSSKPDTSRRGLFIDLTYDHIPKVKLTFLDDDGVMRQSRVATSNVEDISRRIVSHASDELDIDLTTGQHPVTVVTYGIGAGIADYLAGWGVNVVRYSVQEMKQAASAT